MNEGKWRKWRIMENKYYIYRGCAKCNVNVIFWHPWQTHTQTQYTSPKFHHVPATSMKLTAVWEIVKSKHTHMFMSKITHAQRNIHSGRKTLNHFPWTPGKWLSRTTIAPGSVSQVIPDKKKLCHWTIFGFCIHYGIKVPLWHFLLL